MILVDSSVWVDFYNDVATSEVEWLYNALGREEIVVGDLVLAEVLQGFRDEKTAAAVQAELLSFKVVTVSDPDIAVQAERHYRLLRSKGITIRKTIDMLIATRCIAEGWSLLHRDRDYEPFVTHLGLRPAIRAH